MPTARETVSRYFEALTARDADTLIAMMLPAPHYVKIGTDADEVVTGHPAVAGYYRDHVASTTDFSIHWLDFEVQERESVAWFYARQRWQLKWRGTPEQFVMRLTGVLEKTETVWKFAQIHASIGAPTD